MKKTDMIQTLKEKLKIPISNIELTKTDIIIYSNGRNIGKINKNEFLIYENEDFPISVTIKLKWDIIYEDNKSIIDHEVFGLFPAIPCFTTKLSYRKLFVKILDENEVEEVISTVLCSFGDKWDVAIIE